MRLLLLPIALAAQTTITPPQLRWGAPGELDKLKLYAVGLSGMVQVQIGPGLKLEAFEGGVRIVAEPVSLRIVSRVLTQDERGNYPCPECQRVYRNGIRQAEGADYNTNPGWILPIHRWAADDVILGEWVGTEQPAPASGSPTAANFEQIRNWGQVSPNELLPPGDRRRRAGLALSQIRDGDYHPYRLTFKACLFWYERRIDRRSQAPPLTIDCRAATQDWVAWMAAR